MKTSTAAEDDDSTDGLKSEQALWMIIMAMRKDQTVQIEDCRTARDVYTELCGIHGEPNTANRMRLYQTLLTSRPMEDSGANKNVQ